MRTTRRSRGFTLAELLVGLAVTSIVMTAVVAIFVGVQRSYQAETEVKIMTENARGAMLFIERVLPLAGYGLDPRVAFDVGNTRALDNQNVQGVIFSPAQTALPGAATVITDDLAFRFRDPAFLRAGRLNGGIVTLDTPVGAVLPAGKLLMVGCRGGVDYAMVRVTTPPLATATNIAVTNAASGLPFTVSSAPCLQGTGAASPWVFLVQEHRLRIVNLAGRPWLVSFRNLETATTDLSNDRFDPIAPDVEGFQVAFGMNRARPGLGCCQTVLDPSPGNANFIIGDVINETFFTQPGSPLGTLPDYRTGYDKVERYNAHPANIRSVHIALVMRSSRTSPDGRRDLRTDDLFNFDAPAPVPDGYRRSLFHTAISTPNLLSRSGFMPSLRSSADLRDLNTWGG